MLRQRLHSEMGKDPGFLSQLRALSSWQLPQNIEESAISPSWV